MALKYWDGADPKSYYIATQTDNGQWHLTYHGRDILLEYDCKLTEDRTGQQLRYGHGSVMPLRNSKGELLSRWTEATEEEINARPEVKEPAPAATEVQKTEEQTLPAAEPAYNDAAELDRLKAENEALKAQIAEQPVRRYDVTTELDNQQINETRKQEIKESTDCNNGHKVMTAIGTMAAMSVALIIIWQSGLIIPVGIAGLITCGMLK